MDEDKLIEPIFWVACLSAAYPTSWLGHVP